VTTTIQKPELFHRIVYFSRARPGLDQSAVEELVRSAKIKNFSQGITGALLFERGYFFQVLEGPKAGIESLFRAIQNDDRHTDVQLLIEDDLANREFDHWSLAWNRENDKALSEHFEELTASISASGLTRHDLGMIRKFLVIFHGLLPTPLEKESMAAVRRAAATRHARSS
jgi:hypothetical protein